VEGLERRGRLLEVHADCGHIILNNRIVSSRVRIGMRAAYGRAGVPLHASIWPTRGNARKRLARRDIASNACSMRARVRLSDRRRLCFGDKQQARDENNQRGCNPSDRR